MAPRAIRKLRSQRAVLLCAIGIFALSVLLSSFPLKAGASPPRDSLFGLGIAGPYTTAEYPVMKAAGVRQTLVEMTWAQAEPHEGHFDVGYIEGIGAQTVALRAAGFEVVLNTGIQNAPSWLLAMPDARYIDQDGLAYTDEALPNLVFDSQLRPFAESYLKEVFRLLGTDFSFVRAGGGHDGELGYPWMADVNGRVQNLYWAYDSNARRSDPVPSWRPGDPSPSGQADAFLNWYLAALAQYQNWQVSALRAAGYSGWVAMLYPSYGMRPGDEQRAIADDLDGASGPELNGEVQRGYDSQLEVDDLTDRHVVVYGTWGDQPVTVAWLASLAAKKKLPIMAENSGGNTINQLNTALANAAKLHAAGFFLVRAPQLIENASRASTGLRQLAVPAALR